MRKVVPDRSAITDGWSLPPGSTESRAVPPERACGHCGSIPPAKANFCPECGTPHGLEIMDPLTVDDRRPTDEKASVGSRLGTLAGLVAVATAIALLWVLTPEEEVPKVIPSESMVPSTLPPPPESTATTTAPTTTRSPEGSPSAPLFVNDTPGPVLGEGIAGTIIGLDRREFFRIDLATGAIETIEVAQSIQTGPPGRRVVLDGMLVTQSTGGNRAIATDLDTGSQFDIDLKIGAEEGWFEIVGRAGPDTFWMSSEGQVYELDVTGRVWRQVPVPEPFWVVFATSDDLYLEGPGGSFQYDIATGRAAELPGAIGFEPMLQNAPLIVSCDERLECRLSADIGSGEVPLLGLDATDLWYGGLQVSPDLTQALVQRWEDPGPELFHVDLTTGDWTTIGRVEVALWSGATWIPESSWVIVSNSDYEDSEWKAISCETGALVDIDVPGHANRPSEFGGVILIQDHESVVDSADAGR